MVLQRNIIIKKVLLLLGLDRKRKNLLHEKANLLAWRYEVIDKEKKNKQPKQKII